MIKIYATSLLFLLFSYTAFSQSGKPQKVESFPHDSIAPIKSSDNTQVFAKNTIPAVQKPEVAIFYMINDQSVDRLTYLQNRQKSSTITTTKK